MLENKIVLITGASRGIGRAVAIALATQGATVILLGRTIEHLKSVYDEILKGGNAKAKIYPFNLCSATLEDYDDLRRNIANEYGRLDGLIHNAGILGELSPLEHYDVQKWYQVLQVNLNSVFILNQATLPLLKKSASASIIFTLAESVSKPKANWGAYAVANAGCRAMLEMLSSECENITKIRVNAVQLPAVNTKLRNQAYPAEIKDLLLEPEDIVAQYINLMSDDSRSSNGQILEICSDQIEHAV